MHAAANKRSTSDIDWLLKTRLQALTGTCSSSPNTGDQHRPPAFERTEKAKKSCFSSRFEHVSLFISQWTLTLQGSVPAYVRQTALFGQAVGKNDDNVHSHLPYTSPIVDHTFV